MKLSENFLDNRFGEVKLHGGNNNKKKGLYFHRQWEHSRKLADILNDTKYGVRKKLKDTVTLQLNP